MTGKGREDWKTPKIGRRWELLNADDGREKEGVEMDGAASEGEKS